MSNESPAVIIYDGYGNPLAVSNATTIPASTSALMTAGSDGYNARYFKVDASGRLNTVGAGTAGVPTGGVFTVQGIAGGTEIPVSLSNLTAQVQGQEIIGEAPSTNPIMISYLDANGNVRYPTFNPVSGGGFGGLTTYANVTTDLESYRDDFAGVSLDGYLTGTVTFTNGSTAVTGVGTSFISELNTNCIFIKLSSDPNSNYTQLQFQPYYLGTDTAITLAEPYSGSSGSGTASFTYWKPTVGTGGSIHVGTAPASQSEVVLSTGTSTNSFTYIFHSVVPGYVAPCNITAYAKVSQRLSGQECIIGLIDDITAPNHQTVIVFNGTDNTKISLRTSSNNLTVETNTATLPNGLTTNNYIRYRIACSPDGIVAYANDIPVVRNKLHVQSLYSPQPLTIGVYNTSATSNTNLFVDAIGVLAHDQIEVEMANTITPAPVQTVGYDSLGAVQNATVVGPSTAAVSTDSSLVVTLSPNNTASISNIGVLSTNNSSTVALGSSATFTGVSESTLGFNGFSINIMALGVSAPSGTLSVQQSSDGVNWDIQNNYSVAGGTSSPNGSFNITITTKASNFRLVYNNGATAQTAFRLQTVKLPISAAIIGSGVAGTPSTGVVTVQGITGGTVLPCSLASVGSTNSTLPTSANLLGGNDGTNLQALKTFNLNTGAGTDYNLGVSIRLPGGSGSVSGGSSSNPIRIDPTGVTTQPVSGTVNVLQSTASNLNATVVQGTAASLSSKWPVQITDGTNTMPTMDVVARAGFLKITDGTNTATVTAGSALKIDGSAVTQPVSGTVAVTQSTSPWVNNITQFGGSNIATGTGVAGAGVPRVTVSNDSNILATQSGTWTVQPGNTANTTPWLITLNQGGNSAAVTASNALKIDGSAVTQPVSGTVTSNQGTANSLANAWSAKITDATNGPVAVKAASTAAIATDPALVVAVSPNNTVATTAPTLTKGTQGANGWSTQDLKDGGRVVKTYVATAATGATTEALVTLTPYADFAAGSTGTSFAVTSGKRLRMQSIIITWRNNTAAAGGVTVRFRVNSSGTAIVSSPVQFALNATTSLATIGSGSSSTLIFPDGFELSGTMQFAITQIAVTAVVGYDVAICAFEY